MDTSSDNKREHNKNFYSLSVRNFCSIIPEIFNRNYENTQARHLFTAVILFRECIQLSMISPIPVKGRLYVAGDCFGILDVLSAR